MVLSNAKQKIVSVGAALLWCVGLLLYRGYLASNSFLGGGEKSTRGMLWNLFLAVIPLLWSSAFQWANTRKRTALGSVFFFLWLLFLPNAPYLLTDLLHLKPSLHVPLWYLLAVLLSCAGAGTILGYLPLIQVHTIIEQKCGKKIGWAVAVGSLMLCGFGIYLGRFLHWNSWDMFVHPIQLLKSITGQFINPGLHPHPLAVTLVFGVGLFIGYLVLRTIPMAIYPE